MLLTVTHLLMVQNVCILQIVSIVLDLMKMPNHCRAALVDFSSTDRLFITPPGTRSMRTASGGCS